MQKYYLTTTTPYVNSDPHIGFAMEIIHTDVIARFQQLKGKEVIFNTGTDEHGSKIYKKAQELGKDPQDYVDEYAPKFEALKDLLNLSFTNFIRTTNPDHKSAAQEFWRRCLANGDIYKQNYKIKYCIGCELEKTDSELVDDKCPLHPNLELEVREEENYFFRFSKYEQPLLDFYYKHQDFVVPDFRYHEIKTFVQSGLQDFSISRLKQKMPWGVPVPDDDAQVMYVWFDALVNYISTLGWPNDAKNFEYFWGTKEEPNGVQFAGKDNLRQQSAMWQAMLMSAGLPNSKNIVIHGFITSGGQKMSKSLGNVVDPVEMVSKYGTDALRYYLIREIPTFEDGDFTIEKFEEAYNANLANGIGNLTSRILKMALNAGISLQVSGVRALDDEDTFGADNPEYSEALESFNIKKAADYLWLKISGLDLYIQQHEPFKKIKVEETKEKAKEDILFLLKELFRVAKLLEPFLPETAKKIRQAVESSRDLQPPPALFPRLT